MMTKYVCVGISALIFLGAAIFGIAPAPQIDQAMEKLLAAGRLNKEDFPLPPNAIELVTAVSFPSPGQEADGVYLADPRGIAQDEKGRIYVADRIQDKVFIFDRAGKYIKSFGRTGQGPGEFFQPWHVLSWNGQILVSDTGNRRVQFFDQNGAFLDKGFKLPKSYHALAVDADGNIYGAPTYYEFPKDTNVSLIDVLDANGRILRSFGKPIETKGKFDYSTLSRVILSIGHKSSNLCVAFEKFSTLRRYSLKGDLLSEFAIPNPIMKRTSELNMKRIAMRSQSTPVPYAVVQAGISSDSEGLYTFIPAPIIEIIHIDNAGKVKDLYWRDKKEDLYMLGMLAQKDEGTPSFVLIKRLPERSIEILKLKKQR